MVAAKCFAATIFIRRYPANPNGCRVKESKFFDKKIVFPKKKGS